MMTFMADETRKALRRLQAFLLFLLRCVFIVFVNIVILILPVLTAFLFILRGASGFFGEGGERQAVRRSYSESQTQRPALSASDIFQFATRDLRSWVNELRRWRS